MEYQLNNSIQYIYIYIYIYYVLPEVIMCVIYGDNL